MKKTVKKDRGNAERAAVHFAVHELGCTITRRAVRTQWQAVDFFGSDVVGKCDQGLTHWIQATAGQHAAVTARRRKLEAVPWNALDRVYVVQLRKAEDPANARRLKFFFRVMEYKILDDKLRCWETWTEAVDVPREWFKAYEEEPQKVCCSTS